MQILVISVLIFCSQVLQKTNLIIVSRQQEDTLYMLSPKQITYRKNK